MQTPTPEIRQAFYARLLAALPLGEIGREDVAWPNAPFTPQVNRMYLAPWCLFGETVTASLSQSGFERLTGIFQINVYGVLNEGEGKIDEVCRELCDLYRGGAVIPLVCGNSVSILRSWRSGMRLEENPARPVATVSASWMQYTQK